FLTSRLGVAFVKGLQGNDPKYFKVISTAKHFAVHSGPESKRHFFDATCSRRDLFETYLPAFEALVREAKVYSIMGAYNRLYSSPCCASSLLLDSLLRKTWGFKGYVVSDCGAIYDMYGGHKTYPSAVEASAKAVIAGCDLTCGGEYYALKKAVDQELITQDEIDRSVKRLLLARFKLGMFDPDPMVKYAQIPYSVNNSKSNNELAKKVACESMVLLKNNGILPLKKNLKKVAVIGPNANDVEVLLGNYNGTPSSPVTILQGIKSKLDKDGQVVFAQGVTPLSDIGAFESINANSLRPDLNTTAIGWTGEYFDNDELKEAPVDIKSDTVTSFYWGMGSPSPNIPADHFSVRWSGYLTPPATGKYELRLGADDRCRLYLDDTLVVDNWKNAQVNKPFSVSRFLEKDKYYKIRMEYAELTEYAGIKLEWRYADVKSSAEFYSNEALAASKDADVVIFVGGISPRLEGEEMPVQIEGFSGGDRTDLNLPKNQEELLKKLQSTGKPVVLVLLSGSALAVNWEAENLPAILQAWYPGQQGGNAVADILFGDYNPAGRLPVTFYKSVTDLPSFDNYSMDGRTYRYFKGQVLYPFGFGLSYSSFRYDQPKLSKEVVKGTDKTNVLVAITNTSERAGDEVVQVYGSTDQVKEFRPIKMLVGFKRVHIPAGKTVQVIIPVDVQSLRQYDPRNSEYCVYEGKYQLEVGTSSQDIRQRL
ncbi:MAG: glycoside hydrolase family 3 C-terminal domain-containing protein, partial [Bacteroidota bacterium]|nr:glycoside hydrolase family 3 C-terminal domain-containing protein [Bacteroidota bacterium]